jgi:DHA1 family bicyclomycin/chloramphenicol resistance-like MFS transporter
MTQSRRHPFTLILILGALSTVTPLSIDMYLPAFTQIAAALHCEVAQVALSISSYFVGFSVGHLFYGPLLDRYGRKRPVYFGLFVYLLASVACLKSGTIEALITFRFIQALGACVAEVAAIAMVRDFFPIKEASKVFSLLMLILGVSPLFAPTIGGLIVTMLGWQWIFISLMIIVFLVLAVTFFFLPEGHEPDPTISLRLKPIFFGFLEILREPQFYTYAISGSFAFGGLFVYVAGSPILFMNIFHISPRVYGEIFALLSVGLIGATQINILLSKYYKSERIYSLAIYAQVLVASFFLLGTLNNWFGLQSLIATLFVLLSCIGFTYPNAAALALAPFSRNAGSASALLGFFQIGVGAIASAGVGFFHSNTSLPTVAILEGTALFGLMILLVGRKNIVHPVGAHITEEGLINA